MGDENNLIMKAEFDVAQAKKNVESLAASVEKSQKIYERLANIKNAFKGFDAPIKNATMSFRGLTKSLKNVADPFEYVQKQISGFEKEIASLQSKMQKKQMLGLDSGKEQAELSQVISNYKAYAKAVLSNNYLKEQAAARSAQAAEAESQLNNEVAKLAREMDRLEKSTSKGVSAWSKLLGRIRNIGIYRTIRSAMKWITQGVSEGLQGLAQYSDEVNESMSNLKNSLGQVRNTLAISFASVLQALGPIITQLADSIIDVVNAFNKALAKVQGKDFYYKAKKSADAYAESAKKAQKFSFDTFEVLSGGDEKTDPSELFERVDFADEINDGNSALVGLFQTFGEIAKAILEITEKLGGLKTILIGIGTYLAFKGVKSTIAGVTEGFNTLSKGVASVNTAMELMHEKGFGTSAKATLSEYFKTAEGGLNKVKIATTALTSVVAGLAAFGIADTIFGQFQKEGKVIAGVLGIVAAALAGVAVAALAAAGALSWGTAIPAIVAAVAVGAAGIKAIVQGAQEIKGFADGGFTTANFIATNENGKREWVGRNAGATAVVNDTQMSDIMYGAVRKGCYEGILQAIYESPTQSGGGGDVVLQVDSNVLGRVVAESVGFRNEVNRRNATLNLR